MAMNIDKDRFLPEVNVSLLLKLIGRLPIEFFSVQCNYKDQEAWVSTRLFVERFGQQLFEDGRVPQYLRDVFEIKAQASQMPKFGMDVDLIIEGLAKIQLAMGMRYGD